MRMGQWVRTGIGHGGITCVLQTHFSSLFVVCFLYSFPSKKERVSHISILYGGNKR